MIETRRSLFATALLLAIAAAAPFVSTLRFGLLRYDDEAVLVQRRVQPRVARDWLTLLDPRSTPWEFLPLRDLATAIGWSTFGIPALHALPILAHVVATLLVWRFFMMLGLGAFAAFCGAALFAVHPLHAEAVAWASSLEDPLSACFTLAAALSLPGSLRGSWPRALPPILWMLCASLSKYPAIAIVPALLGVLVVREPRDRWRRGFSIVASCLVISVLVYLSSRPRLAHLARPAHSLLARIALAPAQILVYLRLGLAPAALHVEYAPLSASGIASIAAVLLVILLALAAWRMRRRHAAIPVLGALFLIAIGPALAPIGSESISERCAYLALAGLAGLAGLFVARIVRRTAGSVAPFLALVFALGWGSHAAAARFRSDVALWTDAARFEDSPIVASQRVKSLAPVDPKEAVNVALAKLFEALVARGRNREAEEVAARLLSVSGCNDRIACVRAAQFLALVSHQRGDARSERRWLLRARGLSNDPAERARIDALLSR